MDFNSLLPTTMFIDINSCFATIEQQANPFLRYKPVAVGAYTTNSGCILAASYEAKRLGVKTGMRVMDGRKLCPNLIVLPPDPNKYRFVHKRMHKLLEKYSNKVVPKSIDEFSVDFAGLPILKERSLWDIGSEVKKRIKEEIGDYITVSVGISTNRFLAKTASSYMKPDGLFKIDKDNYREVFGSLKLTDLCGIKKGNATRLAMAGITSVNGFYDATVQQLKAGFRSINGYYWYLRLHGYEVDGAASERKSFGNSYALPKPYEKFEDLSPILTKLTEKMARRLRRKNYVAQGIHLSMWFRDYTYWHKGIKLPQPVFATSDFCREIFRLFFECPKMKPVRNLAVTAFNLRRQDFLQLDMTEDLIRKKSLTKALDKINSRYGDFTVTSARMINHERFVHDRIAFGIISP